MEFKVGNKVWEFGRGNGTVTSTGDDRDTYPIEVDFENGGDECYTSDGKRYDDHPERSLFHGWNLKVVGETIPVKCWILKYSNNVPSETLFHSEEDAMAFNTSDPDATYHKVMV